VKKLLGFACGSYAGSAAILGTACILAAIHPGLLAGAIIGAAIVKN